MKRLIPFILIVFFIGCGDDDDKGTKGTALVVVNTDCINSNPDCEIFPLAVGNHWTWERVYYNSEGVEYKRDTIDDAISKDTIINSETWYYMSPIWLTNRSDGVYYLDISEDHWFKYPASVGDQFKLMVEVPSREVLSVDTNITTGLGLFNCYKYTTLQGLMGPSHEYLAPGIGIVKGESYIQTDDTTIYLAHVRTLIDYEVGLAAGR